MNCIKAWLIQRPLETILWYGFLLGVLTIPEIFAVVILELLAPSGSVSWWVVLHVVGWFATALWSGATTLLLHSEYNRAGILRARINVDGSVTTERDKVKQSYALSSNLQRLSQQWRWHLHSHVSFFLVSLTINCLHIVLIEPTHTATRWILSGILVPASLFAILPLIIRAQFRAAGILITYNDSSDKR